MKLPRLKDHFFAPMNDDSSCTPWEAEERVVFIGFNQMPLSMITWLLLFPTFTIIRKAPPSNK